MELGLGFDDSDFTATEKPRELLTSYNAKIRFPGWFLQDDTEKTDKDKATLDKFSGDFYYKVKNYGKAIDYYKLSLGGVQSQNRTMRREITDSLARCYLNTGCTDRAMELADKVMEDCLTRDQICHGLHLKQLIYQKSGTITGEVQVLYQLIHVHPRSVQFWLSLKSVYERLQSQRCCPDTESVYERLQSQRCCPDTDLIDTSSIISQLTGAHMITGTLNADQEKLKLNNANMNEIETSQRTCVQVNGPKSLGDKIENLTLSGSRSVDAGLESDVINMTSSTASSDRNTSSDIPGQEYRDIMTGLPYQLVKLSCCLRIRRILKGVQGTVVSFIKQKNLELQKKMDEEIHSLGLDEVDLQRANRCIWKLSDVCDDNDDSTENKSEEVEVKEMPTFTSEEFNRRWFSWITDS